MVRVLQALAPTLCLVQEPQQDSWVVLSHEGPWSRGTKEDAVADETGDFYRNTPRDSSACAGSKKIIITHWVVASVWGP